MKLRRRRRRSGGFYLFASHLLFLQLLRVVNSNIWFQFVPLGVDYNLNSLLSWFKSSHPSLSLLLLLKCLCSAAFKFNISNHDKVCCLWKLSQNMSSKTVVGLQKQTLLEATATCSSWETEGEKIVLRRFAARQGWHLTVVMRDKWGRRSRGLSCELSKQFQVHCSRCLDFRVLKVYAQVAASYLCRLPTSFFANWLYEVTWPRGSQDLTTLSRHNRKDANKNWRLEKWHDTKIIFGKFFDVWVVSAPLHNLFQ